MKVLLWHGYLLRGSGSNVYTANVARAWRAQGHDVLLLCQERDVADLDFIDEHGDFTDDNTSYAAVPTSVSPAAGRVALLRPAVGTVLPVYVHDEYEGFVAKRFVDLSDAELQTYTDANVSALVSAIERFRPDAIITGHEVMGPEIARRASIATNTSYIAKLHGSGLEFAVKQQERYRRYASDGLGAARVVVGGSRYMVREAAAVVPGWLDRAAVVNPGCDVELFVPRADRDDGAPPRVGFVGKFIPSKGVHLLLAALGLMTTPDIRAVVVGYGSLDETLRNLHGALAAGDLSRARELASAGEGGALPNLLPFLDRVGSGYTERIRDVTVRFTGRLEHGPLSKLLPTFDVLVVPSVLAEAFGMVAAEAAACGVLPVGPRHSGIGEAIQTLEHDLGVPGLLTYDPETPVEGIAEAVDRFFSCPQQERKRYGDAASRVARKRWSWDMVARRLLDLAS
ncbi:MAG TPA: glycosyltransferase family 4 protein [Actinomycetota bacterium]|nr:glycosyltransferase family 4 protein [Actinomycetota bacterium]